MKTFSFRLVAAVFTGLTALLQAAIDPPAPPRLPVTAKELHQGYRDHVILARPHPGRGASVEAAEGHEGLRVRERFPRFRDLRVIELSAGDSADAAIRRLRASGRYEFVEPDYLVYPAAEPNDPEFSAGRLWALSNSGQSNGISGADIKATAAWDVIREAAGVIVAVIDTGVNLAHEDIAPNLWRNPNPTFGDIHGARFIDRARSGDPTDDNGHGTHVAGTIGAVGNNGVGIAGVAWRVQIMAIKALPARGPGTTSDIVSGINYAVQNGAHIINASFGAITSGSFSQSELAAITAARDAGVIFVAAAGNSNSNMDVSRFYPASHALDNVIAVGNSTRRDELSPTTNYGAAVDLFAPGTEIVSLSHSSNTDVRSSSGTSMAAPHVAGALALLRARFPADSYRQLINRLLRSTDAGDRFAGRAQTGGRLNLLAALTSDSNQPFNDTFARRPRFTGDNLSIRSNNAGGTAEPGEPAHAGAAPAASLWWEWVAPRSGLVTVDTAGSSYDTVVAVYSGSALDALTPIASNDDTTSSTTSRLGFTAQAGATYQIAVDGKNGASGLTMLRVGSTPANDAFAAAETLTGQSTRVTATNANCSREEGEPRILGLGAGTSLWFRWVAPRSGRFQVAVFSEDFDPVLAAYTGETLAALTVVDENDNAGGSSAHTGGLCTISATAGTTYRFAVDSKDVRTVGQFTLTLTDSLWQTPAGDAITGAPAIAPDGTIYFGSIDRSLYALSPDGRRKWSFPTGSSIDTSSPAIAPDGTVYVGSNDGRLYALNPDGTQKWPQPVTFRSGGATVSASNSPAIGGDGTVYLKAGDGYLYALEPADGAIKWRFNVRAPESYGSPTVGADGTIYQGSDDDRLYALRPDGVLKWSYQGEGDIYTAPAIDAQGNVYFGVLGTGKLFSVAPDGTHRWTYAGASLGSSSSPCLSPDGGTAYFAGYDRKLHAVNTASGVARWTHVLDAYRAGGEEVRASSPAVDANGVVYVGCYDYKLYAINPDGTLKRTYDTGNWIRSSPAIHGTTLYVGSNDEKLYAFDLGVGPGGGPWPQFRQNARRTGRHEVQRLALAAAPQPQVAILGRAFSLGVVATGDGPLRYQWLKDGAPISGATSATLAIPTVTAATAGVYAVTITNPRESLTSPPVTIPVEAALPGRLINLSVRTTAGSGAQTLTMGFVVRGGMSKPLLIRGVGPTLQHFGLSGTLADPQLQLRAETTLVAENNDWGGAATIASTASSVGAFALPSGSADAALLETVPAGNYTVQLTGAGGATGIALAELYDPEPTNAQTLAAVSRLLNVSARSQVGTGGDMLIAGFTLSGNVPRRVLIRGIGPGLSQFGVGGVLANPRLELYRGSTKVNENDNWGGAPAVVAAAEEAGAFRLSNAGSNDSALLVELAPGSYTAQVSGVNDTIGVALVEVYEIPVIVGLPLAGRP